MIRTVSIVGARPQFVKLAPVSRAMSRSAGTRIEDFIVHTGQHYDPAMSDIFFKELDIPEPDVNLEIGSGSHGAQTAQMLVGIEKLLNDVTPHFVVIYGDTNSTLAGALAAAKMHVPIAHIEAGLRSFDRKMPEEINRVMSDHVSDLLFAPTRTAMDNLAAENLHDRSRLVGDVMLDAIRFNSDLARERSDIISRLGLGEQSYAVVTLHRAANTDSDRLAQLLDALNDIASSQLPIVFPVHPRTVARLKSEYPEWQPASGLEMIDPVGYLDMIRLVSSASVVLTDSGGLQKEAFFLGVPCVTLREETEWPETVDGGGNVLCGADHGKIVDAVAGYLEQASGQEGRTIYPAEEYFGDGDAAEKIVSEICRNAGVT